MSELHTILLAGLTGFIAGLLLSIPPGPVNLTIMNEGARRGFVWALLISFGATVMEVIYCGIAFTGFASLFQGPVITTVMELVTFAFVIFLGIKFLLARSIPSVERLEARIEESIEHQLHPHSAFMIGFVRTMANLGVLVFYIILAASFIQKKWVEDSWRGKTSCVTGVGIGAGVWFLFLAWAASLGHRKFNDKTLLRMERCSGVGLLLLACYYGWRIVSEFKAAS